MIIFSFTRKTKMYDSLCKIQSENWNISLCVNLDDPQILRDDAALMNTTHLPMGGSYNLNSKKEAGLV